MKWLVTVRFTDYSRYDRTIAAASAREAVAYVMRYAGKKLGGTHGNAQVKTIEVQEGEE